MRNSDGTYGKGNDQARETGSVVVTVRLGGPWNIATRCDNARAVNATTAVWPRRHKKRAGKHLSHHAGVRDAQESQRQQCNRKFIPVAAKRWHTASTWPASSVSGTYYAGIILVA